MASARTTGSMDSLKKSIQKSIKKSIHKSMQGPMKVEIEELNAMSAAFTDKLSESAKSAMQAAEQAKAAAGTAMQTAQSAAQTAAQIAKLTALSGLDQVLVNLEHRGVKIKESQDMIQKLGQAVLGRAETIRAQIAENPLAPEWLKEMSVMQASQPVKAKSSATGNLPPEAVGSMSESSISTVAEQMVTEPMSEVLEQAASTSAAKSEAKSESKSRKKTSRSSTSH